MHNIIKVFFFTYLSFFTFLHAVELDSSFSKNLISSKDMLTYIDKDSSKSLDFILKNQDSIFLHVNKSVFTYTTDTIWTKLTLNNTSKNELNVYLMNDFVALDKVDIYLVKDKKVYKKFFFGDTREVSNIEILNRFANINLDVYPQKSIDVFIKYTSTTPINTSLKVFSKSFYNDFILKDFSIWGFFVGISLALVLYNLMIYFSLKEKAFMFYVLHALSNMYNTLTSSGHVHSLLSPILSNEF